MKIKKKGITFQALIALITGSVFVLPMHVVAAMDVAKDECLNRPP